MSVFAVERQRRFSCRCRAAWRTRFSCCLIFGISEKDPQLAGRAMVATPLPMLPSWKTPSGSGRSGGWSATAAGASRASRRTSRATRRSTPGRSRRIPRRRPTSILRPRRDPERGELIELEAQALDQEGQAAQAAAFAPPVTSEEPAPEAESGHEAGASRARASSSRSRRGSRGSSGSCGRSRRPRSSASAARSTPSRSRSSSRTRCGRSWPTRRCRPRSSRSSATCS